jgi:hypothetical protein
MLVVAFIERPILRRSLAFAVDHRRVRNRLVRKAFAVHLEIAAEFIAEIESAEDAFVD